MCKLHSHYMYNFQDINPNTYFLKNILLSDCKKCIINQRDRSKISNQNDKARNINLKSHLINERYQTLVLIILWVWTKRFQILFFYCLVSDSSPNFNIYDFSEKRVFCLTKNSISKFKIKNNLFPKISFKVELSEIWVKVVE